MKSKKTQLHKIEQWLGSLGKLLGPLLKTWLPIMENVLKLLAKNILIPSRLTAAGSATDAAIHKNLFGSGLTTLTIWNEEMTIIKRKLSQWKNLVYWQHELVKELKMKQKNKKEDFSKCY